MDEETIHLVSRFRQGDEDAAEELFSRYVRRLVALANSRLSSKMSRRIDAEDIVQSAYRSFFTRARDGKYVFQQSGDLWRLLVVITLNKLRQKVEFHSAGKRRIDREQSCDVGGLVHAEVVTREPSPVETLGVIEEIEQLTKGLDDTQRHIVSMRLQGYSIDEIASDVQRSERTVRRVMDKVKTRLEQRLNESLADEGDEKGDGDEKGEEAK